MTAFAFIKNLLGEEAQQEAIDLSVPYSECQILAVDIETNHLEVKLGDILSIGWVLIKKGEIDLASCRHLYIDSSAVGGESTQIHGIRDIDRRGGHTLKDGLKEFYRAAKNRVLMFHHAGFDLKFLNAASLKTGLPALKRPYIDTLCLEQRRKILNGEQITPGTLTLTKCRQRYALPRAPQHNALEDALATAELALAMFNSINGPDSLPIKYFTKNPRFF